MNWPISSSGMEVVDPTLHPHHHGGNMMRLGYTIIYVQDVTSTVAFYERAFGLQRRFVHESGLYAEMATGDTTLGFAAESMAERNGVAIRPNGRNELPAGFEICLVTEAPEQGYDQAVAAGALPVKGVDTKPWGQRVGYVRDINGCLVEICSPMAG
ncbi:VOC family protein [Luteibacter aegosomatis]|uniref:VOC family protein n=1 Tax=Luteibacter aegosomatis TaxID=2911537 RepID=UPI001FFA7608|nr:VOC family protein [Luteibacter aegosomatis]UPG84291.1 VOC family protein [Luteibacter aegosomatis]